MEFLNNNNNNNIVAPVEELETEGNQGLKYVEEDVGPGDDSTTVSKLQDKNKVCPLCHYTYQNEADFVTHSASHYARSASTSSTNSSYPNSPNSVETGYYPISPLDNQPRAPPPPYGSHNGTFWPPHNYHQPAHHASPSASFYGAFHHHQNFTCQKCGIFFNSYQHFIHHSNICPANAFQYPPINIQNPYFMPPTQAPKSSHHRGKKCAGKCSCCSGGGAGNKSAPNSNSRKRKSVEKENLDHETLAKMKALEWEQRTGYWCKKCQIRLESSEDLVDHMSQNVHTSPKEPKKA